MNSRIAAATLILLLLAVTAGAFAMPDHRADTASAYRTGSGYATTSVYETTETVVADAGRRTPGATVVGPTAIIIAGLVAGAAAIGLFFFSPAPLPRPAETRTGAPSERNPRALTRRVRPVRSC
ncbi:hypothetical protein [Nocardia bovistercoris]|uniref:Uncharacterized protein n=1 Tax=Nocardia bovistercoris TaxID=2785916 RepID=A0A931N3M9_9NOCA|nr:hypothetical protein [Nocardia bovistercoris]MBH0777351.1 hypothetical protein [Nocardia bovistercoris]